MYLFLILIILIVLKNEKYNIITVTNIYKKTTNSAMAALSLKAISYRQPFDRIYYIKDSRKVQNVIIVLFYTNMILLNINYVLWETQNVS